MPDKQTLNTKGCFYFRSRGAGGRASSLLEEVSEASSQGGPRLRPPLPHSGAVTGPSTFDLCRLRSDASLRGLAWALGLVYTPGTTQTQTPVLFQFETRSRRKRSSPPQTQTCHGPSHHPERLPPEDSGSRAGAIDRSVSPHGLHLTASPETPVVGTFFLFLPVYSLRCPGFAETPGSPGDMRVSPVLSELEGSVSRRHLSGCIHVASFG